MEQLQESESRQSNPPEYDNGIDYGYTPDLGVHPSKQAWYPSSHDDPPPPYESVSPRFAVFRIFSHHPVRDATIVTNLQTQPKDYLLPAILVTVFCCLPCGIIAIIKATKVRKRLSGGDIERALISSRRAKQWCIAGLSCGLSIYGVLFFSALLNSDRLLYVFI